MQSCQVMICPAKETAERGVYTDAKDSAPIEDEDRATNDENVIVVNDVRGAVIDPDGTVNDVEVSGAHVDDDNSAVDIEKFMGEDCEVVIDVVASASNSDNWELLDDIKATIDELGGKVDNMASQPAVILALAGVSGKSGFSPHCDASEMGTDIVTGQGEAAESLLERLVKLIT